MENETHKKLMKILTCQYNRTLNVRGRNRIETNLIIDEVQKVNLSQFVSENHWKLMDFVPTIIFEI